MTVEDFAPDHLKAAREPIVSLLRKCEKAQQKLVPGTWQHGMLRDNVNALRIALAMLNDEPLAAEDVTQDSLQAALRALASMLRKAGEAQSKFAPGTSPYTLQRNRLQSLRVADALVKAALHDRIAEPGATMQAT